MFNKKTLRDIEVKGKKILVRVDFNVPLKEGKVSDDTRIKAALPTIKYLLQEGAQRLILCSHLGRPKGKVVEEMRLTPVAKKLEELSGEKVDKLNDCVGQEVKSKIGSSSSKLVLLENLRFHPEEEACDEDFSQQLASLADIYVNDAFGSSHRKHASVYGVAQHLPAVAGFLMEKEINYLGKLLESPAKPYVAILGGAKVSDKIEVIEELMKRVDALLIGGAMAYTFLKGKGEKVGSSRVEEDKVNLAKDIMAGADKRKVKIVLPVDHVVVKSVDDPSTKQVVPEIPEGFLGVDIGPQTAKKFCGEIAGAKTILWNGPLGIFEKEPYSQGTKVVATKLAELTSKGAITVIGGGDSAAAVAVFNLKDKMSHVSTGGGASLEFLEGKLLPGVDALQNK